MTLAWFYVNAATLSVMHPTHLLLGRLLVFHPGGFGQPDSIVISHGCCVWLLCTSRKSVFDTVSILVIYVYLGSWGIQHYALGNDRAIVGCCFGSGYMVVL